MLLEGGREFVLCFSASECKELESMGEFANDMYSRKI